MLKNYYKIIWRNFLKDKVNSCINIIGLSIGLASCMLIMLYVIHEYSYDVFHKNVKRIFWVQGKIKSENETISTPTLSYATAELAKQNDPEIEQFLRINSQYQDVILQSTQESAKKFSENKFVFADNNFFNFFSFNLLRGDKKMVLKKPFSLVISMRVAKKYFGDSDPVGQLIRYNNKYYFTVTGVADYLPSNSSIDFDFVGSLSSLAMIDKDVILAQSQIVQMGSFNTFFLLNKSTDAKHVEITLDRLMREGSGGAKSDQSFFVRPLLNMHLSNLSDTSIIKYLKIFPFIATIVLLLALINYIGLLIARSTLRSKEVGVRKVIGANRNQIATQFFIESFIYSFVGFVVAYLMCFIIQPYFFNFLEIDISRNFLCSSQMLIALILLLLATVVLSSFYPSIILSRFKPSTVLYGKLSKQSKGGAVRKLFTFFQFTICVSLIICGIVINKQIFFFKHKNTGIDRENIVIIPFGSTIGSHFMSFVNEVQSLSSIEKTSVATSFMYRSYDKYFVKTKNSNNSLSLSVMHVDDSFIPMLRLNWESLPQDSLYYLNQQDAILNETAFDQLNLSRNSLNQTIRLAGRQFKIAGILKDFNYESLQNKIDPLCLIINKIDDTLATWAKEGGCLYVKIKPQAGIPDMINNIEKVYRRYDDENLFEYYFMDSTFDQMYKSEEKLAKLANAFISITLFIACLGLLSLSTFIAQQRAKEICIRKVMGANSIIIITLLTKEFIKIIIFSILMASPIAWWIMNKWLESFAYRIHISWDVFFIAGSSAIFIALVTISAHTIKAALRNPLKALRAE